MRIAHLADIHVMDRRRAEYAAVFEALYASLREQSLDVITVVGDIFDNKMRASAHNLEDVAAFLSALADIAPVVAITGNHDTNCLTPGALDLLTPLLADRRALQPPRLTYWRHSGVYAAHGAVWVVAATDGLVPTQDEVAEGVSALEERELVGVDAPRICLFHNEVRGARMPGGFTIAESAEPTLPGGAISLTGDRGLEQFDAAIGGHIHLRQMLTPRAGYCGSLVQQNIGESHTGHGYVVWTLTPSSAQRPLRTATPVIEPVDIYNPHGFVRIELDGSGADITLAPLPTAPLYWEVIHTAATPRAAIDAAIAQYSARFGGPPRARRVTAGAATGAPTSAPAASTVVKEPAPAETNVADAQTAAASIDAHTEIIRDILSQEEPAVIDAVLAMHAAKMRTMACGAHESPLVRGARIRLVRFEFDNIYAFGPGNVVDFAQLEGAVSGVVAPNHAGKSSLIEALLFALYEAHPRAATKAELIHAGATGCRLALDFEIDGRPARIEKACTRGHAQSSRYRFWVGGEERTGGGTPETLREIAAVVGDAPAALASSFQLQSASADGAGFIAARPSERRRILAAALSLGDFAPLERETAKELTLLNGSVRALESTVDVEGLRAQLAAARADEAAANERAQVPPPVDNMPELYAAAGAAAADEQTAALAAAASETRLGALLAAIGAEAQAKQVVAAADTDYSDWLTRVDLARATALRLPANLNAAARTSAGPTPAELEEARVNSHTEYAVNDAGELYRRRDELIAKSAATFGDPTRLARLEATLVASAAAQIDIAAAQQRVTEAEAVLDRARLSLAYGSIREHQSKHANSACPGCSAMTQLLASAGNCAVTYEEARARATAAADALAAATAAVTAQTAAAAQLSRLRGAQAAAADLVRLRWHIDVLERALAAEMRTNESSPHEIYEAAVAVRAATAAAAVARTRAREAAGAAAAGAAAAEAAASARRAAAATAAAAATRVATIAATIAGEERRLAALATATRDRDVLRAYRVVLRPTGGIADRLLERAREAVQLHINEALVELGAKFATEITPDFEIRHTHAAGAGSAAGAAAGSAAWISVSLASGYQRFVLSLAARLAIWRLATAPRIDALVIDEGFGACDDEYLAGLSSALEALASAPSAPRLIFIVSHVDVLKDRVEHALEIRRTERGSLVCNAMPMARAPPMALVPPMARAPPVQAPAVGHVDDSMVADPADPAKVYCRACQRSFAPGLAVRHLASGVHASALRRTVKRGSK